MTISPRIFALAVFVLLTSVFAPTAHAQIRNPSFEGSGTVANGWSPWHYQLNITANCADTISYHEPTWSVERTSGLVRDGATMQRIAGRTNLFSAGVIQVGIPAQPNARYRFTVWVRGHVANVPYPGASDRGVPFAITAGINPGGGNQTSSGAVTFGAPVNPNGRWQQASVEAVASRAGKISLVIAAQVGDAPNQCRNFVDVWFDEAALINLTPPTARPTNTRRPVTNTPRPTNTRVYPTRTLAPTGKWPTLTPWWETNTPPPPPVIVTRPSATPTATATATRTPRPRGATRTPLTIVTEVPTVALATATTITDEVTVTPMGTLSVSETVTAEPTITATATITDEVADEVTVTPTSAVTVSETVTAEPTITATATITDEVTDEVTVTPTSAVTVSETVAAEPTITATTTITDRLTVTPTGTVDVSDGVTAEATIATTDEVTATATITETPVVTDTESQTTSITTTIEPATTPVRLSTLTPTSEPTDVPTPTETLEPTATPEGSAVICVNTFSDTNGNGTRQDDEGYMGGIPIQLERNGRIMGEQDTMGSAETVCFNGLGGDTYIIRELLPSILRPTTADTIELVVGDGESIAIEFGSQPREDGDGKTEIETKVATPADIDVDDETSTPQPRTGINMSNNSLPILIAGIIVATLAIACTMLIVSRWT